MRELIDYAKDTIHSWESEDPAILTAEAAQLCRYVLDANGLPAGEAWQVLRGSFDRYIFADFDDVKLTLAEWDAHCNQLDFDLEGQRPTATIKLGIVTWIEKFLLKQFDLLSGSEPIPDFSEWKKRLCAAIEKYVGFFCEE